MRDLLNLLDSVITESVGLANRKPGTLFSNNVGDTLIFQGLDFFPEDGGALPTPESFVELLQLVCNQLKINVNQVQWVDDKGNAVPFPEGKRGGFGIAQFDDEKGRRYYLARRLDKISPIRTENNMPNKLPGGFRLQTNVAQKEAAGYKPTDILSRLDNLSPTDILDQIREKFGDDSDEVRATEIFMSATKYPVHIPLGKMNYTAFTNYFCEILQPMALVMGKKTKGSADDAARKFLTKGGYTSCRISFGSSVSGGLIDSTLVNSAGQHMGLSSKAEAGAKASAKNLADKIDEMRDDDDGRKILEKYSKMIKLIETVTGGSTSGSLDTAVLAKIISPEEREQILNIRKLPPGSQVIGKKLLSKDLEKRYAARKARDPEQVIPFFHIRAAIANEVADWVNTKTKFGEVAAEILNWGAFIQVYTHSSQKGGEIILEPFNVIFPSTAVTGVLLSADKTFYSTGSKGNFTFKILYNNASEDAVADDEEDEVSAPKSDIVDFEKGRLDVKKLRGGTETGKAAAEPAQRQRR